jgi:hypothetical protein
MRMSVLPGARAAPLSIDTPLGSVKQKIEGLA